MRTNYFPILILITLVFSFSESVGATLVQKKQRIASKELICLFKKGETVNNREIPAQAIIDVFVSASAPTKTPDCVIKQNSGQMPTLDIKDSIIVGDLYVSRKEDRDLLQAAKNDVPKALREQSQEERETTPIMSVPIGIRIHDTTIENDVLLDHTIFRDRVFFENVKS